jgi:7-carboxy-7-deazaguanine synthase
MLEICEIFSSVQGEGYHQGQPAAFIRCAGCNLRCGFCDTKYAWGKGKPMDEENIVKKVERFGMGYVVITGGEPMLGDLSRLISLLKNRNYKIAVETNGTIYNNLKNLEIDWLTISPKREGLKYFKNGYDKRLKKRASEFKYVICNIEDISFIDRSITVPVTLQPVNNDINLAKEIAGKIKHIKKGNWFLRMQMHKILGVL